MKVTNIITAWKSTVLGVLLIALLSVGVWSGYVDKEALLALIPAVTLIITNLFKEGNSTNKEEVE